MKPCCSSKLAAKLAKMDELSAGGTFVLCGLILASNKEGQAIISTQRLAERCHKSRGQVCRNLAELERLKLIIRDPLPGRSTRYRIQFEPCQRCSAGATGVPRQRDRGVAPARHVSGNPSGNTSLRPSTASPDGPPTSAETYKPVPMDGVLLNGDRKAWLDQIREKLREG